jgi:hypothetical protein
MRMIKHTVSSDTADNAADWLTEPVSINNCNIAILIITITCEATLEACWVAQ